MALQRRRLFARALSSLTTGTRDWLLAAASPSRISFAVAGFECPACLPAPRRASDYAAAAAAVVVVVVDFGVLRPGR